MTAKKKYNYSAPEKVLFAVQAALICLFIGVAISDAVHQHWMDFVISLILVFALSYMAKVNVDAFRRRAEKRNVFSSAGYTITE